MVKQCQLPSLTSYEKSIVIVGSKNGTVCVFFESMEAAKEWFWGGFDEPM